MSAGAEFAAEAIRIVASSSNAEIVREELLASRSESEISC
jgi:hypothetical protein